MEDKHSPKIVGFLLVFLYFTFLYNYGAKLSTMVYTDFPSFYYGSRLAFVEKQSPYNRDALKALAEVEEPSKPNEPQRRIYPYLYPPPSLLLFYPMAKVHVHAAKTGLLAINHLCVVSVIAMLLLPISGFQKKEVFTTVLPATLAIYIFSSKGTFNSIELGQVNLIILALLCVAWWGIKRDWPAWAIALPLGIATVFKIYPILFLALLIIRRKFAAAALTLVVLLGVCGASYVAVPRSLWHEWAHDVLPTGGYLRSPLGVFQPTIAQNIGLAGFTSRLFLEPKLSMDASSPHAGRAIIPNAELGRKITYGLVGLLVLITFGSVFVSSRRQDLTSEGRGQRLNLQFAAFLVLTFLAAPLAWEHHLAYVTPAVVIAILAAVRSRPGLVRCCTPLLILAIACVLGWPMTIGKLPLPRFVAILLVSLKLYAVLALWVFLLVEACRRPELTEGGASA